MIADHYKITEQEIVGSSRAQMYVDPRHVAMYLCVRYAGMSQPQTGRLFGGRDHSSVWNGIRRVRARMASDADFAHKIAEFIQQIEAWA